MNKCVCGQGVLILHFSFNRPWSRLNYGFDLAHLHEFGPMWINSGLDSKLVGEVRPDGYPCSPWQRNCMFPLAPASHPAAIGAACWPAARTPSTPCRGSCAVAASCSASAVTDSCDAELGTGWERLPPMQGCWVRDVRPGRCSAGSAYCWNSRRKISCKKYKITKELRKWWQIFHNEYY